MKQIVMIAVIALIAVSCNKNQKAVKKLDGSWNATEFTVTTTGITIDAFALDLFTSLNYSFDGCKLKKDEFCNVTITIVADGETDTDIGLYTVIDDGVTLQIQDDATAADNINMEIIELSNSTLKLKQIEDEGTEDELTLNLTFEKQ
jgi:hypothetical protein